jgi:4-alpha-glucanotransferase
MVVLQWAWDGPRSNVHALRNHPENAVVYTSTHDTDTASGWFDSLSRKKQQATGLDPRDPAWGLIRVAMASRARLAIVPAQDVLSLGSDARMNRPGRVHGNWRWRLQRGALTDDLAARLREATADGRRLVTRR